MEGFWVGIGAVLIYFVIMASIALLARVLIKIPDELFRKILHCILLGSLIPFVFCFPVWWVSALTAVGFAIAVYPILAVQARLYGAKSLVDICVTGALLSVALLPGTGFSYWLDRIGSAVVAVYLALCGAKTLREQLQKKVKIRA